VKSTLYMKLAEKIRKKHIDPSVRKVGHYSAGRPRIVLREYLPAIDQLCQTTGASPETIRKALKFLANQGYIVTGRGKRAEVVTSLSPEEETYCPPAVARVVEEIAARISSGQFLLHQLLPKFEYLSHDLHTSRRTLHHALAVCRKEELVYKQGKFWYAGPSSSLTFRDQVMHKPLLPPVFKGSVVLVSGSQKEWVGLNNQRTVGKFIQDFCSELSLVHFSITLYFYSVNPGSPVVLPPDCRAIVLFYQKANFSRSFLKTLVPDYRVPVYLFDQNDRYTNSTRYQRIHRNETHAIHLVLKTLYENGHRRIWIPVLSVAHQKPYELLWIQRRLHSIQKCARSHFAAMEILVSEHAQSFWSAPEGDLGHFIDQPDSILARILPPELCKDLLPDQCREILFAHTPDWKGPLLHQKCTAIIALNEFMAREFLLWLKEAGYSVPQDISMISFDNWVLAQLLNLTSIDFRWATLPYQTAQAIAGNLPCIHTSRNEIASLPVLIHRGSVAPVR
jgi:DNA-binding transcriptional regulator YhcF (GntR family)